MAQIRADLIDCHIFRRAPGGVEFLMLQRPTDDPQLGGTWQAVHGKIEVGETASAAALRELDEETGLIPLRFWQVDHVNTFYVAQSDVILMCPCFAAEVATDAAVRLNREHVAFRWLGPDEALRSFMWPGQRRAIREILDEIVTPSAAEPHLRIAPSR